MKTYRVVVHAYGVAEILAPTKAHAKHRARNCDYDSYELHVPEPAISSLDENQPVGHMLRPTAADRPVVFRKHELGS